MECNWRKFKCYCRSLSYTYMHQTECIISYCCRVAPAAKVCTPRWLARILCVFSWRINNLIFLFSLCFSSRTKPTPRSFHSLFSVSNLYSLHLLRKQTQMHQQSEPDQTHSPSMVRMQIHVQQRRCSIYMQCSVLLPAPHSQLN